MKRTSKKNVVWSALFGAALTVVVISFQNCGKLGNSGEVMQNSSAPSSAPCAGNNTGSPYGGGNGSPNNPYQICNAAQFNSIGLSPKDWSADFILLSDLDLSPYSGTQFNLIGNYNSSQPFTGVFNGNSHQISNFNYTNSSLNSYVGMFAYVAGSATIENIVLTNPAMNGGAATNVGILVGGDAGTGSSVISNVSVGGSQATVSGATQVGSIAGNFHGAISNVSSNAGVSGTNTVGGLVGVGQGSFTVTNSASTVTLTTCTGNCAGIVGFASATAAVSNSHFVGSINLPGGVNVGGIVGYANSVAITSSYVIGNISSYTSVGGLSGTIGLNGSISNSYYSGAIIANGGTVGGLSGSITSGSMISTSYAAGSVTAGNNVGGIVGWILTTNTGGGIYNSYSTNNVSGISQVGGLIGYIPSGTGPDVENSYAAGTVTSSAGSGVGGITGEDLGSGKYTPCYFNVTANPSLVGIGSGSATGQISLNGVDVFAATTANLQSARTFSTWSPVIWNFTGGNYPMLVWQ